MGERIGWGREGVGEVAVLKIPLKSLGPGLDLANFETDRRPWMKESLCNSVE